VSGGGGDKSSGGEGLFVHVGKSAVGRFEFGDNAHDLLHGLALTPGCVHVEDERRSVVFHGVLNSPANDVNEAFLDLFLDGEDVDRAGGAGRSVLRSDRHRKKKG